MILVRCEDKSGIDKIDFLIVWEREILRPTDQACSFWLWFWVLGGACFGLDFVFLLKSHYVVGQKSLEGQKYLSKILLIEEVMYQQIM